MIIIGRSAVPDYRTLPEMIIGRSAVTGLSDVTYNGLACDRKRGHLSDQTNNIEADWRS
jgi:hypothetical protein